MTVHASARPAIRAQKPVSKQQASSSNAGPLFLPVHLGRLAAKHRVVLAPLTRGRAPSNVPNNLMKVYYTQRAQGSQGGLLISEATCVSPTAHGYPDTPGIYTEGQTEAWKPIVRAVHENGGIIVCQLWHAGRTSHPDWQPGGALPAGPSARCPEGQCLTPSGEMKPYVTPHALSRQEVLQVIADYARAAENAMAAGFDGCEVHCANGYLPEQFLKDGPNGRQDEYGGDAQRRCRFVLDLIQAVCREVGSNAVGVRLSPFATENDCLDSAPTQTYSTLIEQLNSLQLAYLHLIEPRVHYNFDVETVDTNYKGLKALRELFQGPVIAAGGYDRAKAIDAVSSGRADAIAFGRHYLANPDLPLRLQQGLPLNQYNRSTFYSGGAEGYTDYPFHESSLVP
eukprot:jgi/Astpho2/654/e_gw1.00013.80.1_t